MKKLALCLFGISYLNTNNKLIDYRNSIENYQNILFCYFKKIGYKIDIYLATNNIDYMKKDLLNTYKPINYIFMENDQNRLLSRNYKVRAVVKCCLDSKIKYDNVLITRFDLLFKKNFSDCNIEFDKFNLVYENKVHICDNFYLFPYSKLEKFYGMLCININVQSHYYKSEINEIVEINYICGKNFTFAPQNNPFYIINRNTIEINKDNYMMNMFVDLFMIMLKKNKVKYSKINNSNNNNIISNKKISNRIVPNKTLPNKTVPIKTVPNKTVPNETVPNKTLPNKTLVKIIVPNKIVTYIADSNRIISNKIILFKFKK